MQSQTQSQAEPHVDTSQAPISPQGMQHLVSDMLATLHLLERRGPNEVKDDVRIMIQLASRLEGYAAAATEQGKSEF